MVRINENIKRHGLTVRACWTW